MPRTRPYPTARTTAGAPIDITHDGRRWTYIYVDRWRIPTDDDQEQWATALGEHAVNRCFAAGRRKHIVWGTWTFVCPRADEPAVLAAIDGIEHHDWTAARAYGAEVAA
jgi:hypothetical protein